MIRVFANVVLQGAERRFVRVGLSIGERSNRTGPGIGRCKPMPFLCRLQYHKVGINIIDISQPIACAVQPKVEGLHILALRQYIDDLIPAAAKE